MRGENYNGSDRFIRESRPDQMRRYYLNILKWFLPILFISYLAGITLFTHSHVVNGVTIVHSHPFKKGSEHSHTAVEFQLIHDLNHFQTTDGGFFCVFAPFIALLLCMLLWCPQQAGHIAPCVGAVSLRAPPSFRC